MKTLTVIGGGAAGFFCAVNAAKLNPGMKVLLLEKTTKLLSKVKVSGGGRCNVTHKCDTVSQLVANYPRGASFLKKAFHQFAVAETITWFEERGVALKVEKDGRMFPTTDNSETIMRALLDDAAKYGVEIMLNIEVLEVLKNEADPLNPKQFPFTLLLNKDRKLQTHFICMATGGMHKPEGWSWVEKLGHQLDPTVPSLFTFNIKGSGIQELMGVSTENAVVKIIGTKHKLEGPILITHWGLSGPVVLKLSAWGALDLAAMNYDFKISVNWAPECNEQTALEQLRYIRFEKASLKVYNHNPFTIPQRLWEFLLKSVGVKSETRWADLPAKEQNALAKLITSQEFQVLGKTTFKEEFVTAGGINLEGVNANTMESKTTAGLYFAGEVLNVDGVTGGFNFQNAWTTGWIAATSIAQAIS